MKTTSIFKIYLILDPKECYVGYTTINILNLHKRYVYLYKVFEKNIKYGEINKISVFDILSKGATNIVLLEHLPHNIYKEVSVRLRYHQDFENSVNARKACPDKKAAARKYIDDNIDMIREQRQFYYGKIKKVRHSDDFLKSRREKYNKKKKTVTCDCGKKICNYSMKYHVETKKHKKIMSKL